MSARKAKKSVRKKVRKKVAKKAPRKAGAKKATRKRARALSPAEKKEPFGRPPFEPTDLDRARVETLAGLGALKQDQIALLVMNPTTGEPIDAKTLRRHFRHELARGAPKANAKVAEGLFLKATGKGTQAVTAAIWWEKTRTGMKETVSVEVETKSGVLVPPPACTPEEWIAAATKRATDAKEPGTEDGDG